MLSRVAESVYWMERYRERAENTARFIDVNLNLNLDIPLDKKRQWAPIARTTGDYSLFESLYKTADEKSVLEFLTFDERNPNSILNCLARCRENARSIRQTIITEMWEETNTLYIFVKKASLNRKSIISPAQFYNRIKRQSQLIVGIGQTAMSHNKAWYFSKLGALLERADKTSRIIDVKYFITLPSVEHVGTPYDNIHWAALLKSATGFEMYKKKHKRVGPDNVLNFLVGDEEFPRSIYHCVKEANRALAEAETVELGAIPSRPRELLDRLEDKLKKITAQAVIDYGVHEFLNQIQLELMEINDSVYRRFFSRFELEQ